ncbi:hypothetical protein H6P81_008344 [Aristolochia fimbriata]|uniref:Uncharacterized protein n=1 Tax=Aristolochia fimbriata TaxID=158543 RepID=A0AAV7F538_ARIFI|nr:hypothetical protein H6P81_008344 [Aristolochia fimbriata]
MKTANLNGLRSARRHLVRSPQSWSPYILLSAGSPKQRSSQQQRGLQRPCAFTNLATPIAVVLGRRVPLSPKKMSGLWSETPSVPLTLYLPSCCDIDWGELMVFAGKETLDSLPVPISDVAI